MNRPSDLGFGSLFDRWLGQWLGCLEIKDPRWGQLKKIYNPVYKISKLKYNFKT